MSRSGLIDSTEQPEPKICLTCMLLNASSSEEVSSSVYNLHDTAPQEDIFYQREWSPWPGAETSRGSVI